jgi:hypothetical protein
VVVEPRLRREAEHAREQLSLPAGAHEQKRQRTERLPVLGREQVEGVGVEPDHRPLVQRHELPQRRRLLGAHLEPGALRLADDAPMVRVHPLEQVAGAQSPRDRRAERLDRDPRVALVLVEGMEADERRDDAALAAPLPVSGVERVRVFRDRDRSAVPVGRRHVERIAKLAQDAGKNDVAIG